MVEVIILLVMVQMNMVIIKLGIVLMRHLNNILKIGILVIIKSMYVLVDYIIFGQ